MQASILSIEDQLSESLNLDVQLSFEPFINYIKQRVGNESKEKADYLQNAIERIEKAIAIKGPLSSENLTDYKAEFEIIYKFLVPPISSEEETLWGLGFPIKRTFFYGTSSFYDLMGQGLCSADLNLQPQTMTDNKLRVPYYIIFKKLYGLHSLKEERIVRSFLDPEIGLNRYYQITIDDRFVDVRAKEQLPDLNFIEISPKADKVNWDVLEATLPLSKFSFSGFSVVTIQEITTSYALENIKDMIMGSQLDFHDNRIIDSLKTMVGDKNIEFDLLPFLKMNGKPVLNFSKANYKNPIIEIVRINNLSRERLGELIEEVLESRKRILINAGVLSNGNESPMIKNGLKALNIFSYALIPISHHGKVVGVFEIYSKKEETSLNENVLAKLEEVGPLLAQILENATISFELDINEVIKEKFTSLQSAVQWKFNEKALEYLQNIREDKPLPIIGNIIFEDVYPLYGAVDIRNSTVKRNRAFSIDMEVQLNALKKVLLKLNAVLEITIIEEMIYTCNNFLDLLKVETMDSFQMRIVDFLEREVEDSLRHFKETDPNAAALIKDYESVIDPEKGMAFANRRNLEDSIQLVNTAINDYLELFNVEVQNSYPCYFEKFRTDGVEYDIYIGQSIAPEKPFSPLYLKNIRLWQLTSMAAMARITGNLTPQMKVPLETTQLIFVNVNPIDISFRTDERRFDVEGAYNIRYEIIKKRIDKINIKGTDKRLTQPGKISLVYMNSKDIEQYHGYISFLQNKGVLLDDLEELELEELHDVKGLMGLRVGVNFDKA